MNRNIMWILTVVTVAALSCVTEAGQFVAYSMKEAELRLTSARECDAILEELGGITDLAGLVYDVDHQDIIIVGQINQGRPRITLDDLAVAMRAVFVEKKAPLVSIDKTPDTPETLVQRVHFEGGIENTQLGQDMLEADIVLKKLALGYLPGEVWGVRSYVSMTAEQAQDKKMEDHVSSRFWFKNSPSALAGRNGVFAILDLDVDIETEILLASINGKPVENLTGIRDEIGDQFTAQVRANFDDLTVQYPVLARARPILAMVALARGMQSLEIGHNLDFWLHEYNVAYVETPEEHPLLIAEREIAGRDLVLTVAGGIEFNPIVIRLQNGEVSALKEAVLNSRPGPRVLIWYPPLEGWQIAGTEDLATYDVRAGAMTNDCGFSLDRLFHSTSSVREPLSSTLFSTPLSPLDASLPDFHFEPSLPPQRYSSNVGGVMLQGVAKVSGEQNAQLDLTSGNFSLIVDGKNACLAPEAFRKFITALWAVYYGNRDPGISIDPIAPGTDKHLVRYIGRVMNTDLGRVMREADYLMKEWSIGTERPDIPGFMNPDDISGRRGYAYLGSSRFWFVPEDMRFKRADDMLLFENGRMTLKTEYLFRSGEDMRADPANEEFARFLTDHYNEIAEKYPVYRELFDYAKMVSLAKFLQESGVPLFWFLMANKDLVLVEDSPGTVDALARGSNYFKNLYIEGGVNLGVEGNHVYDPEATRAINEAISRLPVATNSGTAVSSAASEARPVPRSFSFDLGEHSYSIAPQHSLTSGKDRRGVRYQTDLALRATGFQLTEQSWNALRTEIVHREFAKQWNQSIQAMSQRELESQHQILYSQARQKAEKKVAEVVENLRRLINHKCNNEDEFAEAVEAAVGQEQAAYMTSLALKHGYYRSNLELVRYYNPKQHNHGEFGEGWHLLIPYRIKPAGEAKREFLNVLIPEQMAIENLVTGEQQVLTFSTNRHNIAGYVPEKLETSQMIGLFIMSDASYRLADKLGNEFWFDQAGYLTDMSFSQHHNIHFEYLNTPTKAFEQSPYRVEPAGRERVEFLNVVMPKTMVVKDLINGSSEVLVFSDNRTVAGYVPKDEGESRFKMLALMSDASFRLLDQNGNEVAFHPNGEFESLVVSRDYPMLESVSTGPYRVNFKYTIDRSGRTLITCAHLSEEGRSKPVYAVHYQYDNEGRLCRAEYSGAEVAKSRRLAGNSMVVAKK